MIISNQIKIYPVPLINTIDEDDNVLTKNNFSPIILYALNDLDIEERQRRKGGSNYYIQKMKLKVLSNKETERLSSCFMMPCIIEVQLLDGIKKQWGDLKYPVRAVRKSRGNGNEYLLERTSIAPFVV